jgi:hypothetical protein
MLISLSNISSSFSSSDGAHEGDGWMDELMGEPFCFLVVVAAGMGAASVKWS